MSFAGMNYLAVVVAAVASFIFGSVYYMALAKPWREALGKSEADIKAAMSPVTFIVAAVAQLVMAFMLAGLMGHLGEGMLTAKNGLIAGFFVWLGFVITTLAVNHGFQGARRSLTLIDGVHWLGVLLIQGLVLGLMGV